MVMLKIVLGKLVNVANDALHHPVGTVTVITRNLHMCHTWVTSRMSLRPTYY